jgi:hypothetical protein
MGRVLVQPMGVKLLILLCGHGNRKCPYFVLARLTSGTHTMGKIYILTSDVFDFMHHCAPGRFVQHGQASAER